MRRRVRRSERGSGIISTWIGFVVFLGTLLFAVQVLLNLYATSVVNAVAYDAAREVAQADGSPAARTGAENRAKTLLGKWGEQATFDWSGSTADDVVLRVRGSVPGVLLPALQRPTPFSAIDRTVRLRVERWR